LRAGARPESGSAFGKAFWFLIAAAAGTPAFFLVVLWIEHRRGRVR